MEIDVLKRLDGPSRSDVERTRSPLGAAEAPDESVAREGARGRARDAVDDDEGDGDGDGDARRPATPEPVPFVSARRPGTARDDVDDIDVDDEDLGPSPRARTGAGSETGSEAVPEGGSIGPRHAERGDARRERRPGGRRRDRRDEAEIAASRAPAPKVEPKGEAARRGDPVRVLAASEHAVTRDAIGRSALKVLDKLHGAGFTACLVGGGVRDALVGLQPKDFDIATDASPEQVRSLFRNSRIIGRRFRLVHVVFGREIVETATFRAAHDAGSGGEVAESGRIVRDNVYGTIDEDAHRRDFTVNALYWDVADGAVLDHVGGLEDIERRTFRLIGDPLTRCAEDPVRVLRAVRLSAKLGFDIDPDTLEAMRATSHELGNTAPARLFEEVLKLFQGGHARASFDAVREHDLLRHLFPGLDARLRRADPERRADLETLLHAALDNTDRRVRAGKPITAYYLLAFMLWPDVEAAALDGIADGLPVHDALAEAADATIAGQLRATSIPRRFSAPMKEIWMMQPRLEQNRGSRALGLMEDRRFRAAYDFLVLRSGIDPDLVPVADWWTGVQELDADARAAAAEARPVATHVWGDAPRAAAKKRRRKRRPGGDRSRVAG